MKVNNGKMLDVFREFFLRHVLVRETPKEFVLEIHADAVAAVQKLIDERNSEAGKTVEELRDTIRYQKKLLSESKFYTQLAQRFIEIPTSDILPDTKKIESFRRVIAKSRDDNVGYHRFGAGERKGGFHHVTLSGLDAIRAGVHKVGMHVACLPAGYYSTTVMEIYERQKNKVWKLCTAYPQAFIIVNTWDERDKEYAYNLWLVPLKGWANYMYPIILAKGIRHGN